MIAFSRVSAKKNPGFFFARKREKKVGVFLVFFGFFFCVLGCFCAFGGVFLCFLVVYFFLFFAR